MLIDSNMAEWTDIHIKKKMYDGMTELWNYFWWDFGFNNSKLLLEHFVL